ncbi:tRNA (guanine(37)-N1)-methyltransferase 1 [Senna tora]|uniref:tRNA (Guanine(37)-N1)-methyltransferase 1 n=1 Tax=Senna tora TaxID=362788 RepID=A0A834WKL4_9FABA|nr:tRNA (guanine(37)-N1)-methyltransferase 1 [Senna tora]
MFGASPYSFPYCNREIKPLISVFRFSGTWQGIMALHHRSCLFFLGFLSSSINNAKPFILGVLGLLYGCWLVNRTCVLGMLYRKLSPTSVVIELTSHDITMWSSAFHFLWAEVFWSGAFAAPVRRCICPASFVSCSAATGHRRTSSIIGSNVAKHQLGCLVFNMDGRRLIKAMYSSDKARSITQVIMNLPNDAADYLDAFRGIYKDRPKDGEFTFPTIHVYGFSKAEDPEFEFHERIRIALSEVAVNVDMRRVRLVAPGKWMLCASFILPKSVAFADTAVDC